MTMTTIMMMIFFSLILSIVYVSYISICVSIIISNFTLVGDFTLSAGGGGVCEIDEHLMRRFFALKYSMSEGRLK